MSIAEIINEDSEDKVFADVVYFTSIENENAFMEELAPFEEQNYFGKISEDNVDTVIYKLGELKEKYIKTGTKGTELVKKYEGLEYKYDINFETQGAKLSDISEGQKVIIGTEEPAELKDLKKSLQEAYSAMQECHKEPQKDEAFNTFKKAMDDVNPKVEAFEAKKYKIEVGKNLLI